MSKLLGSIAILFLISCTGNTGRNRTETTEKLANTTIEFTEYSHNFGTLHAGEIVLFTFEFTNTGNSDFRIGDVDCACGCVVTRYINETVKPGEKGWVEVEFDSSGLAGREYKSIDIYGNIDELKHLAIFAQVENELLDIKY